MQKVLRTGFGGWGPRSCFMGFEVLGFELEEVDVDQKEIR